MGTPVFKDISLMVFPLFLKSIIVFNFFVLRLIPGGRPILLPFCLANSIPSLVLSLRPFISISAKTPAIIKSNSPIIVDVSIPSLRDIIIIHLPLTMSRTSNNSLADRPSLSIFQTINISPAVDCFNNLLRTGQFFNFLPLFFSI